jgi:proline dehydrogenase
MMRSTLLWLSERRSIFNFVRRNRLAKRFASRFVAGETIASAVEAARELAARGISNTLDLLGESVTDFADVEVARDCYLDLLAAQQAAGIEINASLKLTQFGLDLGEARCEAYVREVVARAAELRGFVRLDMEGSEYTDRTLAMYRRLHAEFGDHVGVVVQSALRRTTGDVERLLAEGARLRLCKGAYLEGTDVAYPDKQDVDANYRRLTELLLRSDRHHGLATHDEAMIDHARTFAQREGIARDRFEFQMLYGIRRDLQDALVAEGWRMRVYIPFGESWYPYLMRRLAERPANIAFILGSVIKEATRRS